MYTKLSQGTTVAHFKDMWGTKVPKVKIFFLVVFRTLAKLYAAACCWFASELWSVKLAKR
jgi:hypothetical protein